ncbi:hypothetical protein [Mycolicibacter sinensis]|uniref:hypothetical protein n=1 Tax=Mycolicibacter sinensis (strain JDM601) TaxID=875328 RepID=UPI000AECF6E9|nr:hypothetical protein [Mycolicibacter sinensis]
MTDSASNSATCADHEGNDDDHHTTNRLALVHTLRRLHTHQQRRPCWQVSSLHTVT